MKVPKEFRSYRCYSEKIKLEVVKLCLDGSLPRKTIMRRYNIPSFTSLYRWIDQYGDRILTGQIDSELMDSKKDDKPESSVPRLSKKGSNNEDARIKALEEQLRRANLKIDLLDRMIDIAEDDLKVPIRKKSGPQQSSKSDKKNK